MNENFRLQLLTHNEIFTTREDAVSYINDFFKPEALKSEPACVYYGTEKEPKLLLAVGMGNRKVFFIDFAMVEEELVKIDETVSSNTKIVDELNQSVKSLISSTGLTYDTNKIEDKITYEPDSKDVLISDAKSIAEAIDILSKYAQAETIKVKNTDSVTLTKKNGTITANVNVSEVGDDDTVDFNDNIIGIKNDGLYASAYLDYDSETKKLTFITSGLDKNGVFRNDAYKQVFDLGNHTEIVAKNNTNSPVVIKINSVDESTKEISGRVKLSEDEHNILEIQDGSLFVNGRANNIAYKDKTVATALNELTKKTDSLAHDVNINVSDTDTVDMTITKDSNDTTYISSNVKLSSNNTINVVNGGLNANIDISVDKNYNKLIVTIGDITKELELPGVDIVESIYFDKVSNNLIIRFKNGNSTTIPLGSFVKFYNFDDTRTVELHEHENEDGSRTVFADLKLRTSDNALAINNNGELYVSISKLTDKLSETINIEIERAKAAEKVLEDSINALDIKLTEKENVINTKIQSEVNRLDTKDVELNTAIEQLSTKHNVEINALDVKYQTEVGVLSDSVNTINGNISSIESSISDLKDITTNHTFEISNIKDNLDATNSSVNEIKTDLLPTSLTNVKNEVNHYTDDAITALENTIVTFVTTENTDIKNRITENEYNIDTLKNISDNLIVKTQELETELDKKVETVELRKDETTNVYHLYVDGKEKGEINIPVDRILEKAEYNPETNNLILTFKTDGDVDSVVIPLTGLIEPYKAGVGLKLDKDNNIFSINKNENADEGYLFVDEDGICVKNINKKFEDLRNDIDGVTDNINTELESIKIQLDKEISNRIEGDKVLEDSINALEQNVSDFESNTNIKLLDINSNIAGIKTDISTLNNKVDDTIKDVDSVKTKIETNTSNIKSNADEITKLKDDINSNIRFSVKDTETLTLIKSRDEIHNLNELSGNVKIVQGNGNIISITNEGLYANVTLTYDEGTNKLTFDNGLGNVPSVIQLKQVNAIKDIKYDPYTKELIFTIIDANGTEQSTAINVADFFKGVDSDNEGHSITISVNSDTEKGTYDISGDIKVSTDSGNLLNVKDSGYVYVSAYAKDHLYQKEDLTTETLQETISKSLKRITSTEDEISNVKNDITSIREEISNSNADIDSIKEKLTTLETTVSTVNSKLNDMLDMYVPLVNNVREIMKYIGMPENRPVVDRLKDIETELDNLIDFGTYIADVD